MKCVFKIVVSYFIYKKNLGTPKILMAEFCSLPENIGQIEKHGKTFGWQDFLIFGIVLAFSAAIGIYFAFRDRHKSSKEYLMGGGNVNPFAIAMSLATTFFSAITLTPFFR